MKLQIVSALLTLCALPFAAEAQENATSTLLDIIATEFDEFSILVDLISVAGLNSTLESGFFTLFAPTDEAFNGLFEAADLEALKAEENRAELIDVLTYHVTTEVVMSEELFANGQVLLSMVNNKSALIDLNDIEWEVDMMASNGIVHGIETVLVPPSSPLLAEAVQASESHTILAAALAAAGLEDDLSAPGNLTLFAPLDSAFEGIDVGKLLTSDFRPHLRDILLYHVYPGPDISAMWNVGMTGTMLNGEQTIMTNVTPGVINGYATVTAADIFVGNGIIHMIDEVLLPASATSSLFDVLTAQSEEYEFTTLLQLLADTGLDQVLSNMTGGPFTLFAPTDDAFGEIPADDLAALTPEQVVDILTLHVAPGVVTSLEWPSTLTPEVAVARQGSDGLATVNGLSLPLFSTPTAMVGPANLVATDFLAANGIMHVIDAVITPASVEALQAGPVALAAEAPVEAAEVEAAEETMDSKSESEDSDD